MYTIYYNNIKFKKMCMLEKFISWKLLGLQENVFIKKQNKLYYE